MTICCRSQTSYFVNASCYCAILWRPREFGVIGDDRSVTWVGMCATLLGHEMMMMMIAASVVKRLRVKSKWSGERVLSAAFTSSQGARSILREVRLMLSLMRQPPSKVSADSGMMQT